MIPFQVKAIVCLVAFVGWTYGAYEVGRRLERLDWVETIAKQNNEAQEKRQETEVTSVDAGKRYEQKRKTVQRKLTEPAGELDEAIARDDVVIPGALGLRLNGISAVPEASQAASEPD